MRPFFKGHVVERVPQKPMIITVNTTKAGSASNTFVLPITKTATELVTIYWGDGQISVGATGNNTHVYAASGVYTIKIYSKIFGGLFFNNAGDKLKILSILSFGGSVHRDLFAAYQGCTNLATIDTTGFINNSLSLLNTFRDCATVTTIRAFPTERTITMSNTFQGCTLLASIPLLALTNCTTITSMFQNCSSLTSIPAFDTSKVTSAIRMCQSCTNLTSVALFDTSKVTSTLNMFYACTNLTTVPLFNLSSVTNATDMFFGVTLTTTSYSDFLINLATLPLQSGVNFSGGNSKYNTAGGVARAYLISNFGWTITDGGAAP